MRVDLTREEAMQAVMLGGTRRVESKMAGLKDSAGFKRGQAGAWDMDIEGAFAEMVVAKALGIYFLPTVGTFKDADLGDDIQIRSTGYPTGRLIVRDKDPDDEVYVMVVNTLPRFTIVGWIYGRDAKQEKWRDQAGNTRAAAYFVPQQALRPFPIERDE